MSDVVRTTFLNIGAGPRIQPLDIQQELYTKYFLVNIDPTYVETIDNLPEIEHSHNSYDHGLGNDVQEYFLKATWQEFIPFYRHYFDKIVIYRVLEHVPMTEVLYFIYMLSTIVKVGGEIEGIVPNYKILAKMLLKENVRKLNFEANNILLTTELLNEPNDPHASIWTPERVPKFFELEGRFQIESSVPEFLFDGRKIYIHFKAIRIK
jgi:hypothetical protein